MPLPGLEGRASGLGRPDSDDRRDGDMARLRKCRLPWAALNKLWEGRGWGERNHTNKAGLTWEGVVAVIDIFNAQK